MPDGFPRNKGKKKKMGTCDMYDVSACVSTLSVSDMHDFVYCY